MELQTIEFNNYDNLDEYFKGIIDISKMNQFLSIIFCSETFREAFHYLYPEDYIFPFKDKKETFQFLSENFHYVPFKSLTTNAITEKLTLESYFFMKIKEIIYSDKLSNENEEKEENEENEENEEDEKSKENEGNIENNTKDDIEAAKLLMEKIFYSSSVVKSNTHEINHEFYNILFFHSNGTYPPEIHRKKFIEERESGKNLETLLFGRVIRSLNLAEALYLLNENNYQKHLNDFRDGFTRLDKDYNIDDLKMDKNCIFYEFNKIINIKNFKEISFSSFISCNDVDGEKDDDLFIDSKISGLEDENDVLGFPRK